MTTAVILFNLGGPDAPEAVKPFLFNLFNDRAIITLPNPFRWLIAKLISTRRAPVAQKIYALIGGKSPILEETEAQRVALQAALGGNHKVFTCMRYWHPRADAVMAQIRAMRPERILLLPLYPQFSTTTTGSSYQEIRGLLEAYAPEQGAAVPSDLLCCYPTQPGFVQAHVESIHATLQAIEGTAPLRLLFSAHGLPQKIVDAGDPYAWQVERTVEAVLAGLAVLGHRPDWALSYQSRVGPMKWLGPSTESEIARAGKEGVGLVVVPIAFVSEHSETLVELDIEYRHLAEEQHVPAYHRVPALGTHPAFIEALAQMVWGRAAKPSAEFVVLPDSGARICPPEFKGCVCRA